MGTFWCVENALAYIVFESILVNIRSSCVYMKQNVVHRHTRVCDVWRCVGIPNV